MWEKISYADFIAETHDLERSFDTTQEPGPDPRRIVAFADKTGFESHYLETGRDGISTYFRWVKAEVKAEADLRKLQTVIAFMR